jgi:hypothetical protein
MIWNFNQQEGKKPFSIPCRGLPTGINKIRGLSCNLWCYRFTIILPILGDSLDTIRPWVYPNPANDAPMYNTHTSR